MNPGDFPELPNPGADHTLDHGSAHSPRHGGHHPVTPLARTTKNPPTPANCSPYEPDKLTVVALDGYRLAIIEQTGKGRKRTSDIIIPAKTLTEVIQAVRRRRTRWSTSAANRRFVVFATSSYTVMSRLIEGEFLNYERVIPEGYHTRVTVDARDFIKYHRARQPHHHRAAEKPPAHPPSTATSPCAARPRWARWSTSWTPEIEGEPVEIGFNNRYLLDALRYSRCDKLASGGERSALAR